MPSFKKRRNPTKDQRKRIQEKEYTTMVDMLNKWADSSEERREGRYEREYARKLARNPDFYRDATPNDLATGFKPKLDFFGSSEEGGDCSTGQCMAMGDMSQEHRASNREAGADPDGSHREQTRIAGENGTEFPDILRSLASRILEGKQDKLERKVDRRYDLNKRKIIGDGRGESQVKNPFYNNINRLRSLGLSKDILKLKEKFPMSQSDTIRASF